MKAVSILKYLTFVVLMVVFILYTPFELTRIILLVRSGTSLCLPSFWAFEIAAIWIGYLFAGTLIGCALWRKAG